MARIIALANQKGGVGKTTTAVNLAASMQSLRRRILLIDMDPQGHATMGSGIDKHHLMKGSACDVLCQQKKAAEVIIPCPAAGYQLLPGNGDLTAAEIELLSSHSRERTLREALEPIKSQFDFILIDCPPTLNMLTLNALTAADGLLIPLQCEFYALEGLSALLDTVEQIRQSVNPNLVIDGIVRTMYDSRISLTRDVSKQLAEYFGDTVLTTVIPRNVKIAEAPSHGLPITRYARLSRGSHAYRMLAKEVIRKLASSSK